jgi:hypothetical protein
VHEPCVISPGRLLPRNTDRTVWVGRSGRFHPSTGTHHFCVSVKEPVDDGFWIGICYPEADGFFPDAAPKSNPHCIVWSGGSPGDGGRPGTVRLHTEKFREQPRYAHRAAIGVVVDTDTGDLSFWLDGTKVLEFPGAAVGKVCAPFFSCTGSVVGPAATLMRWPLDRDYVGSERGGNAASAESGATADMVGTIEICGSMLEGGGQVLRVALAAAALTRTPIHVTRIRAGRPNPGLGHQHATGARLVAQVIAIAPSLFSVATRTSINVTGWGKAIWSMGVGARLFSLILGRRAMHAYAHSTGLWSRDRSREPTLWCAS